MTRATQALATSATVAIIYFVLLLGIFPTPALIKNDILPVVPFWALVAFGSYALGTLGWGVLTFKDKEEKYKELLKEIDTAKKELRAKGVDVD